MSAWASDEVAQARLRAWEGEIAAARMAIGIHEKTVTFFDSREQPFMSQRARERANRSREILWRALAQQADAAF